MSTLPETNIAPEDGWEGKPMFRGELLVSGRVTCLQTPYIGSRFKSPVDAKLYFKGRSSRCPIVNHSNCCGG